MIRCLSLGLLLLLLWGSGCSTRSPQEPTLAGTYIGAAFEMDLDRYHPWPKALFLAPDGSFQHLALDLPEAPIWEGKWEKTRWSLRLDTLAFIHERNYDLQDSLLWIRKGLYTRYYFRAKEVALKEPLRPLLTGKWWESEDQWLFLSEDQQLVRVSKADSLKRVFEWSIDTVGSAVCLVERSRSAKQFCGFTAQLLAVEEDKLLLYHWQGKGMSISTFRPANTSVIPDSAPPAFQPCNPFLYINNPSNRYYYKGTDLPNGNYQVWKEVRQHYQKPGGNTENGLVRIRFIVNCQGETGQFETLELDENYQLKTFHPEIPGQLLRICQSLQGWLPGKDDQGQPIDTYYFITFRIRNGEVVDIFP